MGEKHILSLDEIAKVLWCAHPDMSVQVITQMAHIVSQRLDLCTCDAGGSAGCPIHDLGAERA